jgi:hypothetical protein
MEKHYYFHQCIITITLSNESSSLPLSSVLSLILYTVDTFNSFWRNQTLIETIVMRKNVIDRNVIEDINY